MLLRRVWCLRESAVDVCDLYKLSADLVLTSCLGQRNELISSSVILYVNCVKCVVCGKILYINTLYSNSNVVGVFIVNCCTVVSLTGSRPPPSLAAHEVVPSGARYCV